MSSYDFFTIAIRPESPFCLGGRQFKENLFDSETIISGGVIKGAIASTWRMLLDKGPNCEIIDGFDKKRPELSSCLDKIRITHAFPVDRSSEKRPVVFPHSLVKGVGGTLKDVALHKEYDMVDGAAPAFAVDWKEYDDVFTRFGWPHVKKELRVRTALCRSYRKAANKQLFAYEMVVPDGLEWLATIDLSNVTDATKSDIEDRRFREAAKSQLIDLLLHGLHGWSKTKSSATVSISECTLDTEPVMVDEEYYIVTLQTPALLIKPGSLDETSGQVQLEAVYNEAWNQLSDNNLQLHNFFARQSLAGGYYLHKRFRGNKEYYPWLLTDAGSVFVFKATDTEKAKKIIREWLRYGLPLPKDVSKDGNTWKNCPFIPENGYGEIMLTKELLKPKEGDK